MALPPFSIRHSMTAPPAVGPWPGTDTTTNLDWEKRQQQAMQDALQGLGTLATQAEAAQFQRQQESDRLRNQYLAAASTSLSPPPLAMALPYAAAQFSSALSGNPQVGQQADQSLALNRSLQLQRRSQILDVLAQQSQEAAKRAESAGDLTTALKLNTKANLFLKQLEESSANIREARKTAQDQTFDAWRTMYEARARYADAMVSSGSRDVALAARLQALKEAHDTAAQPILDKMKYLTKPEDRAAAQSALDDLNNRYTTGVEGAIHGLPIPQVVQPTPAPAPAGPPPPPGILSRLGSTIMSEAKGVLKGSVQRRTESLQILDQVFPGKDATEIIAALQEKNPSGGTMGRLLAQKYGVDYSDLMAAARRAAGPQKSPRTSPSYRRALGAVPGL